jgi:large subunit ribosomal protein L18
MTEKSRSAARIRRHVRVRHHILGTPELVSASTLDRDLRTEIGGKSKVEQAKLVGKALAERAKAKGINQVVFDRGGYKYAGRVKALADGAREGGLEF